MRNLLLSIVGPTATGKSQLALKLPPILASDFHFFDLISADSRQVYEGMAVGTGADVPVDFQRLTTDPESVETFAEPYFKKDTIRIHGISIRRPDQDWSVAQFREFAQKTMQSSWQENGLPILVGGTGLYHQHAFSTDQQMDVPPNEAVRAHAERISFANLQRWLKELDAAKFEALNNSDRHNPRRLIRAIEIILAQNAPAAEKKVTKLAALDQVTLEQLIIGLTDSTEQITQHIKDRIKSRLGTGMLEEVQQLIANYDEEVWREPAFSATGYKEVRAYLEDKIDYQQMQELWLRHEVQYAKRQFTWWKKQAGVEWFQISEAGWEQAAIKIAQEWVRKQ